MLHRRLYDLYFPVFVLFILLNTHANYIFLIIYFIFKTFYLRLKLSQILLTLLVWELIVYYCSGPQLRHCWTNVQMWAKA